MDSTVRVLFLGDSAGARRAAGQMESAFGSSFKSVARGAALAGTAITAAIGGGLVAATNQAIGFDKSMRNVNSIAGLSEKNFQKLSKSVLGLSKSTGQGPKVLADGLYDIVSSGKSASQAISIVRQAAIAATAGMTDTATSSAAIVAALNAWHLPAEQAKNVASDLFETVNKGVVSFPQLAQQMGDLTSIAPVLGVSLQETTAAFARLTLLGGPAAERSTQVKQVLDSLLKPSDDLAKSLHSLGYENAQTALKTDTFQGLLQKLYKTTGGNQTEIAKLFPNVRALAGFLGLTGRNAADAQRILEANNKAYKDGTAQTKAFNEQSKSIAVRWDKAKASLAAAAVPLGTLLFPALEKVIGAASTFAGWLDKLGEKRSISAKIDFVWESVKDVASRIWQELSDAITGDSTKKIMVGGQMVEFRNDGQGLASRFYEWFKFQVGETPTAHVVVGGNVVEFKRDPTMRDRFTSWISEEASHVDWTRVVKAFFIGLPQFATKLADGLGNAMADGVALAIKHFNVDDLKTGLLAVGKLLAGSFVEWGKFFSSPLRLLWDRLGPSMLSGATSALNFVATGGLGRAAVAGARLGLGVVTGVARGLAGIAGRGAAVIGSQLAAIPGAVAGWVAGLGAALGGAIISAIVSGISGLTGALTDAIKTAITSVHIPTPHINTSSVHIPGTSKSIPIPTGFSFAKGGELDLAQIMARGGMVNSPMIAMGEEAPKHPEFVIPTNPSYRGRAKGLLSQAARALGVDGYATGGIIGSTIASLPGIAHSKKSPSRKAKPSKGGGAITSPTGGELATVISQANTALANVTKAGSAVDDAGTNYDLVARQLDQSQESFLTDVLDDPTNPSGGTHQERNEADISKRLGEIGQLQALKSQILDLMNAQKKALNDAIAKLRELIAQLLSDIEDLRVQVQAQLAAAKVARQSQQVHTRNANQDRADITREQSKKKPNKERIKSLRADASREDSAAKAAGKSADAADDQRDRLNTMISNRADQIKTFNSSIEDQKAGLHDLPFNIRTVQLDLGDLQNEAAEVSGTKGTLTAVVAAVSPSDSGTSSDGGDSAALAAAQAAQAAAEAQLARYRLALGIQTTQSSIIGSFAKGSLYVPNTGLAMVHRGEQILTSDQAGARSGGSSNSTPVQVVITVPESMAFLRDTIRAEVIGAAGQISTVIGTAADIRRRSNGF